MTLRIAHWDSIKSTQSAHLRGGIGIQLMSTDSNWLVGITTFGKK